LNDYSLGIEVVNAGKLERPVQVLVTWSGQPIVESEGVQLKHKNEALPAWWHCYPQPQVDKVVELCVALKKAYPTIKEIVGHDDIAPGRKVDPGPAWPMDLVRKQVFG
jgi:N-acetylmuramoyl-L-alanine amidase